MAQFQFRLASMLRLREAARDEKRAELAAAFRAEDELGRRRSELQAEAADLKRRHREAAAEGKIDLDRLLDAQRYELLILAEQGALDAHVETLRQEIERRRRVLVEADREVRVLEKLREAQAERAAEAAAAADVKQLDEIAGRRRPTEDD